MGRQWSYTPLLSRFDSCGDYHHTPVSQWQRERPITVRRRFDSSQEYQYEESNGIQAKVVNLKPPLVKETAMKNGDKRRSGHVTGAAIGPGF